VQTNGLYRNEPGDGGHTRHPLSLRERDICYALDQRDEVSLWKLKEEDGLSPILSQWDIPRLLLKSTLIWLLKWQKRPLSPPFLNLYHLVLIQGIHLHYHQPPQLTGR
jgi:hypothetical protein